MNTAILNYGETLKKLLSNYDMSVSALCLKLKLSSRTMINRVIHDECRAETAESFHEKLKASAHVLPFTAEDFAELDRALEITRSGKPYFILHSRMMNIITGKNDTMPPLTCADESAMTFTDLLRDRAKADETHVIIVNCMVRPLLDSLEEFLRKYHSETVDIRHFLHTDTRSESMTLSLLSVLPLLTLNGYRCLRISDDTGIIGRRRDPEVMSTTAPESNRILICRRIGDVYKTDVLNLASRSSFIGVFNLDGRALYDYQLRLAALMEESYHPICSVFPGVTDVEYIGGVMKALVEAERSWQSVLIKQDICVHQIAPEILRRVLSDSPELGLDADTLDEVIRIQTERYSLYRDRGRHEVLIMSQKGLRRFIETGYISDHQLSMAPLSKDEIKQVLSDIVACIREIGGFYVHIVRDEDCVIACSIKTYGESMLSVSPRDGGPLCLVKSRPETQFISGYLLNNFIPKYTMNMHETEQYLCELIESL